MILMSNKKDKSFEEALQELETIVEKLENGDLSLEDAVKQYKDGIALAKHCHGLLENAESVLTKVMNESNEEEAFDIDE